MKQLIENDLKLTLVIDRENAAPRTIFELAEEAFSGGVTALQLREKHLSGRDFYDLAKQVKNFCDAHKKFFVINDRLDIFLAVGAKGLHLGQSDLPLAVARRLCPPGSLIGISAANLKQAQEAQEAGADYLGVGAVFPTGSKDDAGLVKPEEIAAINSLGCPTVAIGGITLENAQQLWEKGFSGLAVISVLSRSANPAKTAAQLLNGR